MTGFAWPEQHPALTDDRLAPYAASAAELGSGPAEVTVLNYLPGRRVTSLLAGHRGKTVLKHYSTHRAHKSFRRLTAFAATDAAGIVPVLFGLDATEHAYLAEYVPGDPLDRLDGDGLAAACCAAGRSLRQLHESGATLERTWLFADEVRQLRRSYGSLTGVAIERIIAATQVSDRPIVPSHRDCHAGQAIVCGAMVRWIDLDDAAMAPAGLDVGNFLGNLVAQFAPDHLGNTCRGAMDAFLLGYGDAPPDLDGWLRLSLARLAGLVEVRECDTRVIPALLHAAEHVSGLL